MITVAILISGQPIAARSAVNVGKEEDGVCRYKIDDGKILYHRTSDGTVALAIKLLKTIQEVGCETNSNSQPEADALASGNGVEHRG